MHRAWMVLLTLVPAVAFGGPSRDAVLDLLNAYEGSASEAELKALGEGVEAELMAIADDPAVPSSRRGRAVSALGLYPTEEVRAFLEQRLATSDKPIVRRKAAYALAPWGEAAVPALVAALSDADDQLRIAAATSLGQVGGDAAKAALQARLPNEAVPAVSEVIRASIGGK